MKRTITTTLVALTIVLFGGFAMPKAAQAANATQTQGGITCYNETTINTAANWPGTNFWYCGQSQTDFGYADFGFLAAQAGNTSNTINAKTLLFNASAKLFVFQNSTIFVTFCTGSVTSPVGAQPLIPVNECFNQQQLTANTRGLTTTGPTAAFPYSVIVEEYIDANSNDEIFQQPPCFWQIKSAPARQSKNAPLDVLITEHGMVAAAGCLP